MKNKLLLLILSSIVLFGDVTPNDVINDVINDVEKTVNEATKKANDKTNLIVQTNQYIKNMVGQDKCVLACPEFKDDYFGRIANIDVQNGKTQCYVYDKQTSDSILAIVTNISKPCLKSFKDLEKNVIPIMAQKSKSQMSLDSYEDLKKIEDKYYKNYTDVGAGREFINVPKYMIAGLTVDNEIIDVPNTLKFNEIRLNPKYTLYPNSNAFSEDKFRKEIQKNNTWLYNKWLGVKELVGLYELPIPSEIQRVASSNLVSSVKAILTNSVIFIMNFLNEYNEVMLIGKTFILFTVLPITIAMAVLNKVTKQISQVADFEDISERILLGIGIFFLFFFSTTNIKTDDENSKMKISQTSFHQMIRPIFYKGAEVGYLVGQSATKAYLKYKLREVGLAPLDIINSTRIANERLKNEQNFLINKAFPLCEATYKTDNLKQIVGSAIGLNQTYPPSENVSRYSSIIGKEITKNFYNSNFMKNPSDYKRNGIMSLSGCYNLERKILENKEQLKSYEYLIEGYNLASKDNTLKKQIEMLANMQFRNDVELGFTALPLLATTSIIIDNIGIFKNPKGDKLNQEELLKDYRQSGGYEIGKIAEGEGLLTYPIKWIVSNMSYMMLPMAAGIENTITKLLKNEDSHNSFKGIISNAVESFSGLKTGIFGIGKELIGAVGGKLLSNEKIVTVIAVFLTILIMMYVVSYLPIIAIATASFSVIFFYYLSIELYYLVIPFLVAFAFASNQAELIKGFMKNGLILAFKPILIVVSVVMALFAKEFFENMNFVLVNWQFEPMFALTNGVDISTLDGILKNGATYAFADFGLVFFKGFLILSNSIIGVIVVFYLVLNGANMILDMFGIRDGFDTQTSIGANVEGRTSQWHNPI
ncbi:hypothetical protein [Arcobacter sp.]|uniref:hypothetical protein n=1 Tax=unclassified Arcobacter TaxID=2593671 RepID=UPI003B00241C